MNGFRNITVFCGPWLALFVIVPILAVQPPLEAAPAPATANNTEQVRIALVSQESATIAAADMLTTTLSKIENVQVLERNEIERLFREQNLSVANNDFSSLGKALGADGLLLMHLQQEGSKQFLGARLVAVKPGVVIGEIRSPWPLQQVEQWAQGIAAQVRPLISKLTVSAADAVPVSILNFRSAVRSAEAETLEQQLTALAIADLSNQRELFVLERRRMDLLGTEKALSKSEDSPFWNGAFLVEGVLDAKGFSPDTVTVSGRLTGRDGSRSEFEVKGSRTNLPQVADAVTDTILKTVKPGASRRSWNPTEEARRYYEEAIWALRWGMNRQAQAAAESAWALGKQDMDAASARVKAYLPDALPDISSYRMGTVSDDSMSPYVTNRLFNELLSQGAAEVAVDIRDNGKRKVVRHLTVPDKPDAVYLKRALHVIGLYESFSRNLPPDQPQVSSPWYTLGNEVLETCSLALRYFYIVRKAQAPVSDELAELRANCRRVAAWLAHSPSARASYFVGDQEATHDTLDPQFVRDRNIFKTELQYGSFWQERPEDCINVYRELMQSPVYSYIHYELLLRPFGNPRVTTWNQADAGRRRSVWTNFVQELRASTNFVMNVEGRLFSMVEANDESGIESEFDGLIAFLKANREIFVTNNIELAYLNDSGRLLGNSEDLPMVGFDLRDKLQKRYSTDLSPWLNKTRGEFWRGLTDRQFARKRSARPLPLGVANAARSNPVPPRPSIASAGPSQAIPEGPRKAAGQASGLRSATVLLVTNFVRVPPQLGGIDPISRLRIFAHRVRENKLWLDLSYHVEIPIQRATNGDQVILYRGEGAPDRAAFGIWNPKVNGWEFIAQPLEHEDQPDRPPVGFSGMNERGVFFELFDGSLYLSQWEAICRYDLGSKKWERLKVPGQKLSRLLAVNGHLYAANSEAIFEITDKGRGTRVLASRRRRPAESSLDELDNLGEPVLFDGPGGSLGAIVRGKAFSNNGGGWKPLDSPLPLAQAEVIESPDGRTEFRGRVVAQNPAASAGSNLFFLAEACAFTNSAGHWRAVEKEGRHADLVCLDQPSRVWTTVGVRFDPELGPIPSQQLALKSNTSFFDSKIWMGCAGNQLVIGQGNSGGVWTVNISEIEKAIAAEREKQGRNKGPAIQNNVRKELSR